MRRPRDDISACGVIIKVLFVRQPLSSDRAPSHHASVSRGGLPIFAIAILNGIGYTLYLLGSSQLYTAHNGIHRHNTSSQKAGRLFMVGLCLA
jgi:hypothetical protein